MNVPAIKSIDKFIKEHEEELQEYIKTPVKFTKLLHMVDNIPAGTTGWFYSGHYPTQPNLHMFKPYNPLAPNKWIDKYGSQQIALVRKEDVE